MSVINQDGKAVCLGLGSNLGNSLQILQDAWHHLGLQDGIRLQALSSPYRTEPVGMNSEHWFINAAGLLSTTLSPEALLAQLLRVEHAFGRRRNPEAQGYRDRTLDLDILLYGDLRLQTPRLCIPHPEMHKRLFVLVPLAELVADRIHPELQCSMEELKARRTLENRCSLPEQIRWPSAEKA